MDDVNFCICKLCGISIGQLSIDLDDRNPLPLGLSRGFRFSVEFSTLFFFRTRHKKGFEPEFFSIKTNVPEIFFLQEIDTTLFLFSTPYEILPYLHPKQLHHSNLNTSKYCAAPKMSRSQQLIRTKCHNCHRLPRVRWRNDYLQIWVWPFNQKLCGKKCMIKPKIGDLITP